MPVLFFYNTSNRIFESDEGIIRRALYFFIADNDGQLYENIGWVINDEFNECSGIKELALL